MAVKQFLKCFKLQCAIVCALAFTASACAAQPAQAQSGYFRHVLFDNSLGSGPYFYSSAQAVTPSTLDAQNNHLPVDREHFKTPPNALRLTWQSHSGGGW